jgi:hypothetical protein
MPVRLPKKSICRFVRDGKVSSMGLDASSAVSLKEADTSRSDRRVICFG